MDGVNRGRRVWLGRWRCGGRPLSEAVRRLRMWLTLRSVTGSQELGLVGLIILLAIGVGVTVLGSPTFSGFLLLCAVLLSCLTAYLVLRVVIFLLWLACLRGIVAREYGELDSLGTRELESLSGLLSEGEKYGAKIPELAIELRKRLKNVCSEANGVLVSRV